MSIYNNKNILVTGGSGVIGRELSKRLAIQGANVRNVDFNNQPTSLTELGVEHIQVDLSNPNSQFLFRFQPDYVFHLAADFERSTETKNFWDSNWKNNILASRHLLEEVVKYDSLKKIIFASSYLIYNKELYNNPASPKSLSENDPTNPRNLCGLAKLQTETDLNFLSKFYDIKVVSARIYRVYGKGDRAIITRWVRDILNGKEINIFDEKNSFDYVLADDVAEGLLRLGSNKTSNLIYNLGSGQSSSINDVFNILQNKFPNLKYKKTNNSIQSEGSYANMDRFKEDLNWCPSTSLKNGIEQIIDYEQKS
jgi:nucleoside-diphosphate-sugar epimerase|tara:strand:- start:3535 stop:4464 length:930 start_codon:yes stop_codon:yes gene_type:complete